MEVSGAVAIEVQVVDVLRPAEQLEELDRARGPAADLAGELLEQRERALAPARRDQVGDLAARDQDATDCAARGRRWAGLGDRPVADQIADVRNDPVIGGLDEPVLVELGDVVLDDIDLLGDDLEQGLERIAAVCVPDANDRRQERIQAIEARIAGLGGCGRDARGGGHGSWFRMRVSGTPGVKMTSSAGRITPWSLPPGKASTRSLTPRWAMRRRNFATSAGVGWTICCTAAVMSSGAACTRTALPLRSIFATFSGTPPNASMST